MVIRKGTERDIEAITAIYEAIHDEEEAGRTTIGWKRGTYPVRGTAQAALAQGTLYVLEREGKVAAAANINQIQVEEYADCPWQYPASDEQVLVLHTLVVDPAQKGHGCGSAFVRFYEELARQMGCPYLRMDTNKRNSAARALYKKLGYAEPGIVECEFNGISGVQLVCLEKKLIW